METVCDPSINIGNLRQFVKTNMGIDIKLSREELCEAYASIQNGQLPLPPLVMTKDRTHLLDKRSPLSQKDYNLLFSATTLLKDLQRIARKIGIKKLDSYTKDQLRNLIGGQMKTAGIREPIRFARTVTKRQSVTNNQRENINVNVNMNNQRENVNVNMNMNNQRENVNVNMNNQNQNTNKISTVKFPNQLFTRGSEPPRFITGKKEPSIFFKETPNFIKKSQQEENRLQKFNIVKNLQTYENSKKVPKKNDLKNFLNAKMKNMKNKENAKRERIKKEEEENRKKKEEEENRKKKEEENGKNSISKERTQDIIIMKKENDREELEKLKMKLNYRERIKSEENKRRQKIENANRAKKEEENKRRQKIENANRAKKEEENKRRQRIEDQERKRLESELKKRRKKKEEENKKRQKIENSERMKKEEENRRRRRIEDQERKKKEEENKKRQKIENSERMKKEEENRRRRRIEDQERKKKEEEN